MNGWDEDAEIMASTVFIDEAHTSSGKQSSFISDYVYDFDEHGTIVPISGTLTTDGLLKLQSFIDCAFSYSTKFSNDFIENLEIIALSGGRVPLDIYRRLRDVKGADGRIKNAYKALSDCISRRMTASRSEISVIDKEMTRQIRRVWQEFQPIKAIVIQRSETTRYPDGTPILTLPPQRRIIDKDNDVEREQVEGVYMVHLPSVKELNRTFEKDFKAKFLRASKKKQNAGRQRIDIARKSLESTTQTSRGATTYPFLAELLNRPDRIITGLGIDDIKNPLFWQGKPGHGLVEPEVLETLYQTSPKCKRLMNFIREELVIPYHYSRDFERFPNDISKLCMPKLLVMTNPPIVAGITLHIINYLCKKDNLKDYKGRPLRATGIFSTFPSTSNRAPVIDKFNQTNNDLNADDFGPQIIVATTRVGGLGLEFTAAIHTILLEPQNNKPDEEQAACRAHRIGQIAPGTFTIYCADTLSEIAYVSEATLQDVLKSMGPEIWAVYKQLPDQWVGEGEEEDDEFVV